MRKLLRGRARAFTLIEMLTVLLIISVLIMLFVPNLSKQKEKITETGQVAVVKVVESQAELYELNNGKPATLTTLLRTGSITQEQSKTYKEYHEKNPNKPPRVPS